MWAVHERVLVRPYSESFWYPGTVRHADGERYYVILDNREDGWFRDHQLRPLQLSAGMQVAVGDFSSSQSKVGVVEDVRGSVVQVRTTDGMKLSANLASIRVPERPSPLADHGARVWATGDRVLARWGGGRPVLVSGDDLRRAG